jgi:hypothetical protein
MENLQSVLAALIEEYAAGICIVLALIIALAVWVMA